MTRAICSRALLSRRELLAASPVALAPLSYWAARLAADGPTDRSLTGGASEDATGGGSGEITAASKAATKRATDFLLRTFNNDDGCGTDVRHPSDIGCTAMVGLALLSQGHTVIEGELYKRVDRVLRYMLRTVAAMPPGNITSQFGTQLQNKIGVQAHTFFATLFLSQVIGEDSDEEKRVRRALTRLVDVIARQQTSDGHWGQESWAPMLGTVMGWVALRGAHYAGFRVQASAEKTATHIVKAMTTELGRHQQSWMHQLYKNATGVRVLYAIGKDEQPVARQAFESVLNLIKGSDSPFSQAGGEEFLSFHLITETMLQKGGGDWKSWYPLVREKLLSVQNSDGSWTGHHCITSRTFCTAAAVLVLSAPNRFLPISQQ
ncbi:MAG: prenyltransferase/squalene oxidase repeat-containing protein [Pirellulales bacterium]